MPDAPNLWVPGAAGPLDQFVERVHRIVGQFASTHGLEQAAVEVEFPDGALVAVTSISAEPGFGFITLTPHPEDPGEPEQLIVPVGAIRQIRLSKPEPAQERFGFSLPS
jgi:hypothetical protein